MTGALRPYNTYNTILATDDPSTDGLVDGSHRLIQHNHVWSYNLFFG